LKNRLYILYFLFIQVCLIVSEVSAHPGSGLVIDQSGNLYFAYTGVGVAKITPGGKISFIYRAVGGGHWICLDEKGFFAFAKPRYFDRITALGEKPVILYASGGSPIVVNPDGNFYYCGGPNGIMLPGAKTLIRETAQKKQTLFCPGLEKFLDGIQDGITGLAAAADSSIYIACWNAILRVTPDGKLKTMVHPVVVKDCDVDPADHREENRGIPLLRGIAVDPGGTVYVAATSCHCLLQESPDGKLKTILKAERPWSPTAVALYHGEIYVLEYTHANGPASEGWVPRIRKIGKDGKISLVADFSIIKNI
jgi:hypothetical protein